MRETVLALLRHTQMTIAEIAVSAGVSAATVNKIRRDARIPKRKRVKT